MELDRRSLIESKAAEHNAKATLAQQESLKAIGALLKRTDISEIVPIIDAIRNAAAVEMYGLWITSLAETNGDIVSAWEMVDRKISEKREYVVSLGDQSSSE